MGLGKGTLERLMIGDEDDPTSEGVPVTRDVGLFLTVPRPLADSAEVGDVDLLAL